MKAPHPRELDAETRAVRIADLVGVPRITATRFVCHGIRTLGELSDWCGPDRHIRGILGPKRALAFQRSVETFWADRETEATIRAAFSPDAFAQEVATP